LATRAVDTRQYPFQIRNEGSFFQDQAERQRLRAGSFHQQIVHRAADGQTADVSARKEDRPDNECVGCESQTRAVDFQLGRIVHRLKLGIGQFAEDDLPDQALHLQATGPVCQPDTF